MKLVNIHTGEIWEPAAVQGNWAFRRLNKKGTPNLRERAKYIGMFSSKPRPTSTYQVSGNWMPLDEKLEAAATPIRAQLVELHRQVDSLHLSLMVLYLEHWRTLEAEIAAAKGQATTTPEAA